MIYLQDIIKGISGAVENVFGAPPITNDQREGFPRPCLFLEVADDTSEKESLLKHFALSFVLYCFAENSHDGYLSLITARNQMDELLSDPIAITERFYIYPENLDFEIDRDEMFVSVQFDIDVFQQFEEKDTRGSSEDMDTLDVDSDFKGR